jgi:hypothetical protein
MAYIVIFGLTFIYVIAHELHLGLYFKKYMKIRNLDKNIIAKVHMVIIYINLIIYAFSYVGVSIAQMIVQYLSTIATTDEKILMYWGIAILVLWVRVLGGALSLSLSWTLLPMLLTLLLMLMI